MCDLRQLLCNSKLSLQLWFLFGCPRSAERRWDALPCVVGHFHWFAKFYGDWEISILSSGIPRSMGRVRGLQPPSGCSRDPGLWYVLRSSSDCARQLSQVSCFSFSSTYRFFSSVHIVEISPVFSEDLDVTFSSGRVRAANLCVVTTCIRKGLCASSRASTLPILGTATLDRR